MVELQRLDPLLDVQWNPKARIVKAGYYLAEAGKRVDPVYDGRWEVIRWNTPGLNQRRDYTVLFQVCEWKRYGARGVILIEREGAYAPLGPWLVEYMRTCDAANVAAHQQLKDELDRQEEAIERDFQNTIADRAAHQEALEKVYHKAAGPYWMGGAQGKAHPITVREVFGKGRKTAAAAAAGAS